MAYNQAGDGANVEQLAVTSESVRPESELIPPLEVKVRALSPLSVMVTWYDSTLGQNQKQLDNRYYTVKYNALSG